MEKVILKWRNSDGRCTHKKNNHRHNGGLSDCIYKYCPYFEECALKEGDDLDEEIHKELKNQTYKRGVSL